VATGLTQWFPGQHWPLAAYIALMAVLSLACVLRLAENVAAAFGRPDIRRHGHPFVR